MHASTSNLEIGIPNENIKASIECRHCQSKKTIKYGKYKTQHRGYIQRYFCKDCKRHFVEDDGFLKMKNNEKMICMSIDSYIDGLSSRKMRDQLNRHSDTKASHVTVLRWVRKYAKIVINKTKDMQPTLSGHYHTDETEIRCAGKAHQLAVILDDGTRFIPTATYINTDHMETKDIKPMWKESEQTQRPHTFQSDGHMAYYEAFRKVFGTRKRDRKVKWIRNLATKTGKYNVKVERFWGIVKDRINQMRGFSAEWSAPILLSAIIFHYNFVRVHGSLKQTPSEAAKLEQVEGANRWLEWIRKK